MSTSMIGAAGGKVTVTGLTAGTVKKGTTVTVKQGAKTVESVIGTFAPKASSFAGITCEQTYATATYTVKESGEYTPVVLSYSGESNVFKFKINNSAPVSYGVNPGDPYCTGFGPYTDTSGSSQLMAYGATGVFPKVQLNAGDKVIVELSHVSGTRNMAFVFLKT